MPKLFKSVLYLIVLLLLSGPVFPQCYELVWSDEFENSGPPDPANWGYDLGGGGWGNSEIQIYTNDSENARVENGRLLIEAVKQGNGTWTSARVKSQGLQSFKYGRMEFRAKLPTGSGTWPALWMLGEDFASVGWPACGEIDIMEHVGKDPGKIHGSLHSPSSFGATQNTGSRQINDFNTTFHRYAVEWTTDDITFMVNDIPYYIYSPGVQNSANWPFNTPFFFIMNIAMGGNFGSDDQYETGGQQNGVDPNLNTARMEVDYVRVYQTFSTLDVTGETLVTPGETDLQYTVNNLAGGDFTWMVPADATITSGQGTNVITVQWGDAPGDVSVEVVGDCGTYNASLSVETVSTPQGDAFILDDFEDSDHQRWTLEAGADNILTLTETNGELRVQYDITSPGENPRLVLNLEQPVDLSVYSKIRVKAKTNNLSGTVSMRIDLFDATGVATNATPVFKLEPLVDNGEYFTYEYDFTDDWESSFPSAGAMVDPTRIAGLHLYINYGLFGSPGSDEVVFEVMDMVDPNSTTTTQEVVASPIFDLFPNPARETVRITLHPGLEGAKFIFCDQHGRLLRSSEIGSGQTTHYLDVHSLSPGIYFLAVRTRQRFEVQKLVVH